MVEKLHDDGCHQFVAKFLPNSSEIVAPFKGLFLGTLRVTKCKNPMQMKMTKNISKRVQNVNGNPRNFHQ